ncbi:PrgI family protein [Patescibacteria group bacterium]|nr:PrgI family protein [Patescibacteria group bacterium]
MPAINQFVVPQFIDVEDKIFGPVTTRQFVILLVAGLTLFIAYRLADMILFIFLLAIIGGFALILAFVKINGQPFHYFLLNILQTVRRPSLRLWNKTYTKRELLEARDSSMVQITEKVKVVPRLSYNRIRDLSLIVNTGGYYKGE